MRARMIRSSLLAAAAAAALSCGSSGTASPPGASVICPSGARYAVEIADTPEFRARGLMYRESLPARHGMLFLFPRPSVEAFWMKDCNFAIDIVWMDGARRVLYVQSHTPPCREEPCPTYGPDKPSQYVLEIPDGAAAREGIAPGAVLRFEKVPGNPAQ